MNPSVRESPDTSLALDAAGLPEPGGPETEAQRRALTALWLADTDRLEAAPAETLPGALVRTISCHRFFCMLKLHLGTV